VTTSPVRIGLAVLALVPAAWFALGVRQSAAQSRAETIIDSASRLSAPRAREATDLLNEAGTLNPDRQIELDRSKLLLERGQPAAARRDAQAVIRVEPQNILAWLALAYASGDDVPVLAGALHHVAELSPLIAKR